MANGNGLSLEGVHLELEKLGSIIRSLSTQIAGVRVRVSDLEHWDGTKIKGELNLLSKQPRPKGKPKGKGTGKPKGKGRGKPKGKGKSGRSAR
jgi:hypothetical protein